MLTTIKSFFISSKQENNENNDKTSPTDFGKDDKLLWPLSANDK